MKRKVNKKLIIFIICFGILVFVIVRLGLFYWSFTKNEDVNKKMVKKYTKIVVDEETGQEKLVIDFENLKKQNSDIKGWILYGKKINYPIVQASDNNYYLTRAFNKTNNEHGAIFMDYRNTSWENQNVIIFGHNTIEGRMFGSLNEVYKKDFFDKEDNKKIKIIDVNNKELNYEIFSYYRIEPEEYYITPSFENNDDFQKFIDTLKNRSLKKFDVSVGINDKILTLSTCYGNNKRTVIHAKLIN